MFHTFFRCPWAVSLWQAMVEHWVLPDIRAAKKTCLKWLFGLLYNLNEVDHMRVVTVLWRSWHVQNKIVHDKQPPMVEASQRFLVSYDDSPRCIRHFPTGDMVKGKM